ncbi:MULTISPECIES: HNH endonuclease [Bacillaceae]|uniref:Restriction endonuclease n=1 Tax=Domibacillus aminovorans TaxID=29332 RepID=A0A177KHS6_9BACI|nr:MULTISPECIES: HNH endonuclease [Bacillaceae]OAH52919.1 restriction endonuclease [Domibacillus aminovorans]
MNSFVVMQGHTYQEEKEQGIIWSPQKDKGGNTPHSWLRMTNVKEGDRFFHYVKGNINAISVAVSNCQEAAKPTAIQNFEQWGENGYLAQLQYHELEMPLNIRTNFDALLPLLPLKYSPFQQDGNGNQGYLYPCNEELAIKLLELISDLNIYEVEVEQLELAMGTVRRTERNTIVPIIAETEAEAKAKIRLGQQKFKRELLPLWDHKCALCGIELPALLRASHSKPWKDSTDVERVDPFNGVLLCCNHDALYDKGYIAFDGQGRLHISSQIPEMDYVKYNIHPKMKIARYEENKPYFKWHKRDIFQY